MGFINKTTLVIDAILTKRGRNYLRKAVFGENQNKEHVIAKFALSDDEIDYGLWDETPSGSNFVRPLGQIIDNQPLTEAVGSDNEIMRYFLFKKGIDYSNEPELPLPSIAADFIMTIEQSPSLIAADFIMTIEQSPSLIAADFIMTIG